MTELEISHHWSANEWEWPLQHHDGVVKVMNTKDKFEVGLEVTGFKPDEISVRVVDHDLVIKCEHEERKDEHGKIQRQVFRTYHLPEDVDTTSLNSHLSQKGILLIHAYKKQ